MVIYLVMYLFFTLIWLQELQIGNIHIELQERKIFFYN